jgi:hypothetical protein
MISQAPSPPRPRRRSPKARCRPPHQFPRNFDLLSGPSKTRLRNHALRKNLPIRPYHRLRRRQLRSPPRPLPRHYSLPAHKQQRLQSHCPLQRHPRGPFNQRSCKAWSEYGHLDGPQQVHNQLPDLRRP